MKIQNMRQQCTIFSSTPFWVLREGFLKGRQFLNFKNSLYNYRNRISIQGILANDKCNVNMFTGSQVLHDCRGQQKSN